MMAEPTLNPDAKSPLPPWLLNELKAFLRIEHNDDDANLASFLRTSIGLCEQFIGQILVNRHLESRENIGRDWARLPGRPVTAILSVSQQQADGTVTPLPAESYAIDIDVDGDGWVRMAASEEFPGQGSGGAEYGGAGRLIVAYRSGMAADWNDVAEPLRQGIIRLSAHLYTHRDDQESRGLPSAVSALWKPYRRIRLR